MSTATTNIGLEKKTSKELGLYRTISHRRSEITTYIREQEKLVWMYNAYLK
ncbi:hypothetical protein [Chitinophaga sp. CF418]|uniref:hypothetical protein n=1 Tax=Chitinophaga sp. CF418 TaxID=1855287 RepID=UPI000919BB58|nr:hypothetical protein [Chitinophaga sp. CF418]SHM60764.1 hypothetical protein SAMN05216311_102620 [Chitinophaga sp. CF418]